MDGMDLQRCIGGISAGKRVRAALAALGRRQPAAPAANAEAWLRSGGRRETRFPAGPVARPPRPDIARRA